MFIRTNTNIYEVEDKREDCYIVGEMAAIRKDQVISKEVKDVYELFDSFCLISKDNEIIFVSEDVLAIESLSLKFEDSKIYAMIWTCTKSGLVSPKFIAYLEDGKYQLINFEERIL